MNLFYSKCTHESEYSLSQPVNANDGAILVVLAVESRLWADYFNIIALSPADFPSEMKITNEKKTKENQYLPNELIDMACMGCVYW